MAEEIKPLGWMAALEDWNEAFSKRPMEYRDWASLTCGEQQRYAARECQTKGAVYSSKVSGNEISFTIKLPASLAMQGLTKDDARRLESYLHRRLEEQVAAILSIRRISQEQSL